MKQLLTAMTLVAYLLFSNGVVVSTHFCMNKVASRHLFGTSSDTCARCGMDFHSMNGCCSDEEQLIKEYQDQQTHELISFSLNKPEPVVPVYEDFQLLFESRNGISAYTSDHDPPGPYPDPLYIRNRVFRI